jgi:predicted secreted protein
VRHTGTNTLDEGLFAAMEQKLSTMDERLQEISSKITTSKKQTERQTQKPKSNLQPSILKHKKKSAYQSDMRLDPNNHLPLEITTLTQVPNELPEFFRRKFKPSVSKIQYVESNDNEKVEKIEEDVTEVKIMHSNVCEYTDCNNPKFSNKHCSVHTGSNVKKSDNNEKEIILSGLEVEKSEKITKTEEISSDDNVEEDDDDLGELKKRIEQSLSNLDQAEVE